MKPSELYDVLSGEIPHPERRALQAEHFGRGKAGDIRFYHFMWKVRPHICEECMRPLSGYSATYVSHILTRGGHPAIAHDPRNVNILCAACHNKWEFGNRKEMRINAQNEKTIEMLKREYYAEQSYTNR